ncbi:MAG: XRE family transcriptional regulator [Slackia piriformis]|uniref:XRE family transcriptional regulator n=1 Tax=Slackia piriformis TaxID=626934 RepID=A0A943UX56_9ACTN|nr:XRE family transcriptional regulator [Slackia piriformis]
MADFQAYLDKRGIGEEQMRDARAKTALKCEAYALRQARKAAGMTQTEIARIMGVSQNRVSKMENGDIAVMSIESVRRYIEAIGGTVSLVADLPTGRLELA